MLHTSSEMVTVNIATETVILSSANYIFISQKVADARSHGFFISSVLGITSL